MSVYPKKTHPSVLALANITPPVHDLTKSKACLEEKTTSRRPSALIGVTTRKENMSNKIDTFKIKPEKI